MSFAAALQWWEDWQLRLLVLASLFFQYFLFAAAVVRKLRVPHWFRGLIWLAYEGGDVVAIYALATLFNQHKEEVLARDPAAAGHLDTLWAPVLLLHLGGQDGITAYSIEDNENWRRHLLFSVSQITVAIYVFRKSWWSGDTILLRAAILLFVPGILKCLEKPWALKNATATSIMNSSDPRLERTIDEDDEVPKGIHSQEEYVKAAAKSVVELEPQPRELLEDDVSDDPYHLLVDRGHPYSIRLRNLRLVAPREARADVHSLVRWSLSKAFNRLYTKHKASFGGLLRAAVVLLTFVDIGLFQRRRSHDRGGGAYEYGRADVVVTYVLLCCTAALELVSACLVLGSGLPPPDDRLAQYNLVGYLARGEKHPWLWALARRLGAMLPLDQLWCTAPPEPSLGVTRLVYNHVAAGWKDYIWKSLHEYGGVRAYRRFNDSRGQWTLERERCVGVGRRAIEESLRMPFDESVLLWHLATELCYFDHVDTGHDATRHSRTVSNYMAYLLVVQPEMLMPGARSTLFGAAYAELRKMLKPPPPEDEAAADLEPEEEEKAPPPPSAENEMVRKVIQKVEGTISLGLEDVVHKAWAVAHELMEFAKDKEKDFIKDEKARGKKREELMKVLRCAKKKADEFIDVRNKKRDEVLNKLMKVMDSARKEADELIKAKSNKGEESIERKEIFMKVMKEAKEKAELFMNEEERITKPLQCAKYHAEELIKNEEEKKEAEEVCCMRMPMDTEEERERKKALTLKEFTKNAEEVIQGATRLAEEEKKKLMESKKEAKDKAVKFIDEATKFINEEKKMQTNEEEKITDLLESAKKMAEEFVNNEGKMTAEASWKEEEKAVLAVKEFSEKAGEATKLVDLRLMIRGRKHADDRMWVVIQGVWVEMLCFSAGRCRGYLHAKSLANGGEYLSYVWLLLSYMGMETMAERMQRPELPAVGDAGDLVKIPTDDDDMDDGPPAQPAPTPPASSRPGPGCATTESSAGTAQAQRLVATPMPATSVTAAVPIGDDIV